ncbi:MAG: glycosyltransferase [Vannielia sp.]|uniref:glycosyl transferase family 90 n=1 Tax=Vannielia sp. TaxID=2813045 RepID=UPI003B8CE85D
MGEPRMMAPESPPDRPREAGFAKFRRDFRLRQETRRQLTATLGNSPGIRVGRGPADLGESDVLVRREAEGFAVLISPYAPRRSAWSALRNRSAAYVCWLAQAGTHVREISGNTSDGNELSCATYSFCSFGAQVPLPDYYFFRDRGYAAFRETAAESAQPWDARSSEIIWRGGPNGLGLPAVDPAMTGHPAVVQRVAMAQRCKGTRVDFKFVAAACPGDEAIYARAGLMGAKVAAASWGGRRYAIDIDGYSNAWDNFFHRLLLGCCVLKVASHFGYRQWYYDRLTPGEHYVSIRSDLSDLEEKVDWVLANPDEARDIAQAGQRVALEATWDGECARVGEVIERNWAG